MVPGFAFIFKSASAIAVSLHMDPTQLLLFSSVADSPPATATISEIQCLLNAQTCASYRLFVTHVFMMSQVLRFVSIAFEVDRVHRQMVAEGREPPLGGVSVSTGFFCGGGNG